MKVLDIAIQLRKMRSALTENSTWDPKTASLISFDSAEPTLSMLCYKIGELLQTARRSGAFNHQYFDDLRPGMISEGSDNMGVASLVLRWLHDNGYPISGSDPHLDPFERLAQAFEDISRTTLARPETSSPSDREIMLKHFQARQESDRVNRTHPSPRIRDAEDRQVRCREALRSTPKHDPATLRSVVEGLRKMGDLFRAGRTRSDIENISMDLLCEAIRAGAFSGSTWLTWRTTLAETPHISTAIRLLYVCSPLNVPELPVLPPNGVWGVEAASLMATLVERFIGPIPASTAQPGYVVLNWFDEGYTGSRPIYRVAEREIGEQLLAAVNEQFATDPHTASESGSSVYFTLVDAAEAPSQLVWDSALEDLSASAAMGKEEDDVKIYSNCKRWERMIRNRKDATEVEQKPVESPPAAPLGTNGGNINASQGTQASVSRIPPQGEWSKPMSKAEIMTRLGLKPRAFGTFCKSHELKMISRQQWQIRLDSMDASTRRRIETGR
jgi:hypothetical protein